MTLGPFGERNKSRFVILGDQSGRLRSRSGPTSNCGFMLSADRGRGSMTSSRSTAWVYERVVCSTRTIGRSALRCHNWATGAPFAIRIATRPLHSVKSEWTSVGFDRFFGLDRFTGSPNERRQSVLSAKLSLGRPRTFPLRPKQHDPSPGQAPPDSAEPCLLILRPTKTWKEG